MNDSHLVTGVCVSHYHQQRNAGSSGELLSSPNEDLKTNQVILSINAVFKVSAVDLTHPG